MKITTGRLAALADGSNMLSDNPSRDALLHSLHLHLAAPQDWHNHEHSQLVGPGP
uniref:Uncharacterized protein n=1 Tax=Arundo donax TaxID=35708 RepID=A0A0A9CX46_ARUDO